MQEYLTSTIKFCLNSMSMNYIKPICFQFVKKCNKLPLSLFIHHGRGGRDNLYSFSQAMT
eukprot:c51256_g1_i1 orf=71-250(+)